MLNAHADGGKRVFFGRMAKGYHAHGIGVADKQRFVQIILARVLFFNQHGTVKHFLVNHGGGLVISAVGHLTGAGRSGNNIHLVVCDRAARHSLKHRER